MVWLKIRRYDIFSSTGIIEKPVVVWLKIRRYDIVDEIIENIELVVVWLKIRRYDIKSFYAIDWGKLWFD